MQCFCSADCGNDSCPERLSDADWATLAETATPFEWADFWRGCDEYRHPHEES